jgi:hypothetical protein
MWRTGDLATVPLWIGQLPSERNYQGRVVIEEGETPPSVDLCLWSGSKVQQATLNGNGNSWPVGEVGFPNEYAYDGVGFTTGAVTYYRGVHRAPCAAQVYQDMYVYCNSGPSQRYHVNDQQDIIGLTTVGSSRAGGVTSTEIWP